jgi:hypothetical protein
VAGHRAVDPAALVAPLFEVVLENVEHAGHLREDEDLENRKRLTDLTEKGGGGMFYCNQSPAVRGGTRESRACGVIWEKIRTWKGEATMYEREFEHSLATGSDCKLQGEKNLCIPTQPCISEVLNAVWQQRAIENSSGEIILHPMQVAFNPRALSKTSSMHDHAADSESGRSEEGCIADLEVMQTEERLAQDRMGVYTVGAEAYFLMAAPQASTAH